LKSRFFIRLKAGTARSEFRRLELPFTAGVAGLVPTTPFYCRPVPEPWGLQSLSAFTRGFEALCPVKTVRVLARAMTRNMVRNIRLCLGAAKNKADVG
jgi:hypothetical protein